jgi:hypothetical protein
VVRIIKKTKILENRKNHFKFSKILVTSSPNLLCLAMPPVSTVYAGFFLVSLALLFLIFCVKLPEMWRSWRLFFRQMSARKTRQERMLADLEKLMAEAERLEGIYCFETVEVHHAPSRSVVGVREEEPMTAATAA